MRYFHLLKKRAEERKHYLGNLDFYLREIAYFFKNQLGEARAYCFGSILTDRFDSESDVDVLVISPNTPPHLFQRSKLISRLRSEIGFLNPFEIHLITPQEYEDWYSRFIKKERKEISLAS